jgi:hypothetical protein
MTKTDDSPEIVETIASCMKGHWKITNKANSLKSAFAEVFIFSACGVAARFDVYCVGGLMAGVLLHGEII